MASIPFYNQMAQGSRNLGQNILQFALQKAQLAQQPRLLEMQLGYQGKQRELDYLREMARYKDLQRFQEKILGKEQEFRKDQATRDFIRELMLAEKRNKLGQKGWKERFQFEQNWQEALLDKLWGRQKGFLDMLFGGGEEGTPDFGGMTKTPQGTVKFQSEAATLPSFKDLQNLIPSMTTVPGESTQPSQMFRQKQKYKGMSVQEQLNEQRKREAYLQAYGLLRAGLPMQLVQSWTNQAIKGRLDLENKRYLFEMAGGE